MHNFAQPTPSKMFIARLVNADQSLTLLSGCTDQCWPTLNWEKYLSSHIYRWNWKYKHRYAFGKPKKEEIFTLIFQISLNQQLWCCVDCRFWMCPVDISFERIMKKKIGWGCVGADDHWFQREASKSCCEC